MKRRATIYNAYDLLSRPEFYRQASTEIDATIKGATQTGRSETRSVWVPARALGPSWNQWKALWLVWTGRADVLHWPGQET